MVKYNTNIYMKEMGKGSTGLRLGAVDLETLRKKDVIRAELTCLRPERASQREMVCCWPTLILHQPTSASSKPSNDYSHLTPGNKLSLANAMVFWLKVM